MYTEDSIEGATQWEKIVLSFFKEDKEVSLAQHAYREKSFEVNLRFIVLYICIMIFI